MHNFKTTDITNLDIVVPPITEQKEFVNRVSIAKELRDSQKESSSEISSNLMSMSQRAFRGEL